MSIVKILLTLIALYLFALAGLYLLQRKILFHPEASYTPLAQTVADKNFREINSHTADGLDLKAWYAPATTHSQTLVFFHGNGDSLRTVAVIANLYAGMGYGFLAVEYRGYSGLPGTPTEAGLYDDARANIKTLLGLGVREKDIVLFAHSLGTGVAIQMATEFHVAGIMLMSPYMSIGKVAQQHYPMFSAELLVKDRFESFSKIAGIHTPLLIVHGERDNVIPYTNGQELFDLANEPKTLHLYPDAGHNNLFSFGFEALSLAWLAQLPAD